MADTMFSFSSVSETKAVEVIYDYLQLDLLTNPECSLISNVTALGGARTFSRAQNSIPKTFRKFRKETFAVEWDACLCVAGTDSENLRRVVVTYSRDLNKVIINFPSAVNGFSTGEIQIKGQYRKDERTVLLNDTDRDRGCLPQRRWCVSCSDRMSEKLITKSEVKLQYFRKLACEIRRNDTSIHAQIYRQ